MWERLVRSAAMQGERRQMQVRLAPDVYDRLKAEAETRYVSVNWIVEHAVLAWLDNLEATRT